MTIPKIIFQTYKYEILPTQKILFSAQKTWKNIPGWEYRFYDDEMSRNFIKEHFTEETLFCFDIIKPGAFRADLLRACLLYIYGGVYADIKIIKLPDFNLDEVVNENLVLVRDIKYGCIWNGFICSPKKNNYFINVIKIIINNVKKLFFPLEKLFISGPGVFFQALETNRSEKIVFFKFKCRVVLNFLFTSVNLGKRDICDNNNSIIMSWEQNYYSDYSGKRYTPLMKRSEIYNIPMHKKYFKSEHKKHFK